MMFTEPLAAKIIKGEKTATRRVMSDNPRSPWSVHRCLYDEGQVFTVNPGRGVTRVAECKVTRVSAQPPDEIKTKQAKAEGFSGRREFLDAFTKINRGVNLAEAVWVVEFQLVGPTCLGCDGCGWCEGSPAFLCPDCFSTGIVPSQRAREFVGRVEREMLAGDGAEGGVQDPKGLSCGDTPAVESGAVSGESGGGA